MTEFNVSGYRRFMYNIESTSINDNGTADINEGLYAVNNSLVYVDSGHYTHEVITNNLLKESVNKELSKLKDTDITATSEELLLS